MIKTFACPKTEQLAQFRKPDGKVIPPEIFKAARRKLAMIHSATQLEDLKQPPGNRLEKLEGDRKGQYSIRINQKWRICFNWLHGDAYNVEIVDYH